MLAVADPVCRLEVVHARSGLRDREGREGVQPVFSEAAVPLVVVEELSLRPRAVVSVHEPELFGVKVVLPLAAPVLAERSQGLDQHLRRSGAARRVGCGSNSAYKK